MIKVTHERRAGLTARDVPRRTSHVDVDNVCTTRFRDARAFGHPVRFAACELYDMRTDTGCLAAQNRHRAAAREIVTCCHFGNNESGSQFGGQTPERRIRNPGHRRKEYIVGDLDVANRQICLTR